MASGIFSSILISHIYLDLRHEFSCNGHSATGGRTMSWRAGPPCGSEVEVRLLLIDRFVLSTRSSLTSWRQSNAYSLEPLQTAGLDVGGVSNIDAEVYVEDL